MAVHLPVLHFNDVYRVRQKVKGTEKALGADQFAAKINAIRETWGEKNQQCQRSVPSQPFVWDEHAQRDRKGLCVFSGDLYNPSVESSITRGAHMVPVINAMQVDVACLGNHDWDFGYPHLQTLMSQNNFPWLFSNVVDASWREDHSEQTPKMDPRDQQIQVTLPYFIMTVQGIKIACIGLVEEEWLDTVPGFPDQFEYRSMVDVAMHLSKELREGEEKVELIIAVTHCRMPNDVDIANALGAVRDTDPSSHGVDLILGGHDHIYYVGRGVHEYQGADYSMDMPGAEKDKNTFLIKSGTDFHDLSELEIVLSEPQDAVRRRTISSIKVQRHEVLPSDPSLPQLEEMLDHLMSRMSKSIGQPVAYSLTEWDARARSVRMDESPLGDFIADIILISMERSLRMQRAVHAPLDKEERAADCCLICGGSLRGDSVFGPGEITLANLLEIMPFEDPIIVKELTGQDIWDALENGFSAYPKQEGRFPQVAGLRVVWDSSKEPNQRVVSVDLLQQPFDGEIGTSSDSLRMKFRDQYVFIPGDENEDDDVVTVHRAAAKVKEPLQLDKKYRVVTRSYLCAGNDGYTALTRGKYIIDHEAGELMSTIVRKFLLGATYIWRWKQLRAQASAENDTSFASDTTGTPDVSFDTTAGSLREQVQRKVHLSSKTDTAVQRAVDLTHMPAHGAPPMKRRSSLQPPIVVDNSPVAIRDALFVAGHEHHSSYDSASRAYSYDRKNLNDNVSVDTKAVEQQARQGADNLAVVLAMADGRLVDSARAS